ncbi:MAG TPA: AI-2E family transporter [Daejeonella sp.]|nr:AI-2E family transporter [Daejeonella sp.]
MKPVVLPFYAKVALILISIIALGYILVIGQKVLAPLLFAFLFSTLLMPVAKFFEIKLHLPRGLASLIAVILFIVFIASVLLVLGSQFSLIVRDWPVLQEHIGQSLHQFQQWAEHHWHIKVSRQLEYIHSATDKLLADAGTLLSLTLVTVSTTFLFYSFVLVFTFFMLFNRRTLFKFLLAIYKNEHAHIVNDIIREVQSIIKRYIMGLFLQMGIVSMLSFTVFLTLGVQYALFLGLIAGMFNVIPYVGIFTAMFISLLLTFGTAGASKALLVLLSFLFIHTVDANFIMPVIVGSKVKLNPMVVILGIICGEMMWGISGMFLCVPYLAILKIIFDRIDFLAPWSLLLGEEVSVRKRSKPKKKDS